MKRKLIILILAVIIAGGGTAGGIVLWHQGSGHIATDNAVIGAPLISVSSLSTGQITAINAGIGERVASRQVIAEIGAPRYAGTAALQGFRTGSSAGFPVEAPVAGYVAAVWSYPGAVVSAGSPIITLFDDSSLWVTANIDEKQIRKIRPGQEVEVAVDCLGGEILKGRVLAITPATASSFSLLPSGSTSASFTRVSQVVPVRIELEDYTGLALIPGSSVEVKIKTD